MTTESSEMPEGFVFKPDDGKTYREGKDGRWYTYQDCSKANRLYLSKKWESELGDFQAIKDSQLGDFQAIKDSHAPKKTTSRKLTLVASEPKAPTRRSSRPSVVPDTIYSTAAEEAKKQTTNVARVTKLLKATEPRKVVNSWEERREQQWNKSYESLQKYEKANGDYNVTMKGTNKKLFHWLVTQRNTYRNATLSTKREGLLRAIHYPLDDKRFNARRPDDCNTIHPDTSSAKKKPRFDSASSTTIVSAAVNIAASRGGDRAPRAPRAPTSTSSGSSFDRLKPLIVNLRDLLSKSELQDCAEVLQKVVCREMQEQKKNGKSPTTVTTSKSPGNTCHAYRQLLSLAMEIDNVEDASKDLIRNLVCCEKYFKHLIHNATTKETNL